MNIIGEIIYELSKNRNDVESRVTDIARPMVIHLIKIYIWRDTEYKDGWIKEVCNFLNYVPTLKGSHKHPKGKDLYEWLWKEDREKNFNKTLRYVISLAGSTDKQYKSLKRPTNIISPDVKDFVDDYMRWVSFELSSEGEIDLEDVRLRIESLLRKYPYELQE